MRVLALSLIATVPAVAGIASIHVSAPSAIRASVPSAQRAETTEHRAIRSATISRDINNFSLGMTIVEARMRAPIDYIGGDQFESNLDGITYNFGVTPRSRIYRISSSQTLGRFNVDQTFLDTFRQRLIEKYGAPAHSNGDVFDWELFEHVQDASGYQTQMKVNWMSAYIGGQIGPTIEMTLIDFRILWEDQNYVNQSPREQAERSISF